jgi:hypothetical protein
VYPECGVLLACVHDDRGAAGRLDGHGLVDRDVLIISAAADDDRIASACGVERRLDGLIAACRADINGLRGRCGQRSDQRTRGCDQRYSYKC